MIVLIDARLSCLPWSFKWLFVVSNKCVSVGLGRGATDVAEGSYGLGLDFRPSAWMISRDPCLNEDSLDSLGFYRCSSSWRLFSVLFTEFLSLQKAALPVEQQKLNRKEGLLHFRGDR